MRHAVGDRLKLLRGISTLREAASRCGLTSGHWFRLESGQNRPTARTARRIAAGYGVDPEWILGGKGVGSLSEVAKFEFRNSKCPSRPHRFTQKQRRAMLGMERIFLSGNRKDQRRLMECIELLTGDRGD